MKNIKLIAIIASFVAFSGAAFADGMMFEPVDVNVTPIDSTVAPAPAAAAADGQLMQPASSEKFQNAILQLDSVQVELRNTYLSYKEKYQQVDAQYKKVKEERKATNKIVKNLEKKIKEIEKTKSNIRKTMQ